MHVEQESFLYPLFSAKWPSFYIYIYSHAHSAGKFDTVPMAFSTYYTSFSAKWPSFTHSFWAKWPLLYCSKWQHIFITILLTKLAAWSLWLTLQSPSTFSTRIYMNPVHIASAMHPVINYSIKKKTFIWCISIGYIKNVHLAWMW